MQEARPAVGGEDSDADARSCLGSWEVVSSPRSRAPSPSPPFLVSTPGSPLGTLHARWAGEASGEDDSGDEAARRGGGAGSSDSEQEGAAVGRLSGDRDASADHLMMLGEPEMDAAPELPTTNTEQEWLAPPGCGEVPGMGGEGGAGLVAAGKRGASATVRELLELSRRAAGIGSALLPAAAAAAGCVWVALQTWVSALRSQLATVRSALPLGLGRGLGPAILSNAAAARDQLAAAGGGLASAAERAGKRLAVTEVDWVKVALAAGLGASVALLLRQYGVSARLAYRLQTRESELVQLVARILQLQRLISPWSPPVVRHTTCTAVAWPALVLAF